jgi:electron transfer flavoprotein beta subunit
MYRSWDNGALNIVVCIKRVPDTGEAQVTIAPDGKSIKGNGLVYDINEADNYALEEALLLKEKLGGTVTVLTVGNASSNEQLRVCLAKGADNAIRLDDERFAGSDGFAIARILVAAIKDLKPDLILSGCIASDDASAQVGIMLGEMLMLPHATVVAEAKVEGNKAMVKRELEGGLTEVLEIELPALLAVQTGINEPRYASFRGIREAMKREIKVLGLSDLGINPQDVGEAGSKTKIEKLFIPPIDKRAQFLEGSPDETASSLVTIFKEKGIV